MPKIPMAVRANVEATGLVTIFSRNLLQKEKGSRSRPSFGKSWSLLTERKFTEP
jgi:hypothetical protein